MTHSEFRRMFSATRKWFRDGGRPQNFTRFVSFRREDLDGYATAEAGGEWVVRHSALMSFWHDAGLFEREIIERKATGRAYRRSTVQAMRNARLAATFRPLWG